jgi:hypothetical protein
MADTSPGVDDVDDPSGAHEVDGEGRRRRRRRRRHPARLRIIALGAVALGGVVIAAGWWALQSWRTAYSLQVADQVPGVAAPHLLRTGEVLAVPEGGRLVVGGPLLTVTMLAGTKATVALPAEGLDLALDGDGALNAVASLTAPQRLRVTAGACSAECTAGAMRLRRHGDGLALAAFGGPVQVQRAGSAAIVLAANTWTVLGGDGHYRQPRPAANRPGMLGWWPADEGGGTVLHDRGGNGAPWPLTVGAGVAWTPSGLSGRAAATLAAGQIPADIAAALIAGSCTVEVWCARDGAAEAATVVGEIADGTGASLRVRLPPLPLAAGLHHLVVSFGHDRHQLTWVDGRLHADVPAAVLPEDLRPPLSFIIGGATTVRACALFGHTLGQAEIAELFNAGADAP